MRACSARTCSGRGNGWSCPGGKDGAGCAGTCTTASPPRWPGGGSIRRRRGRYSYRAATAPHASCATSARRSAAPWSMSGAWSKGCALGELGLTGACTQAVERLTAGAGLAASVYACDDLPALPAAMEVAAYRIVVRGGHQHRPARPRPPLPGVDSLHPGRAGRRGYRRRHRAGRGGSARPRPSHHAGAGPVTPIPARRPDHAGTRGTRPIGRGCRQPEDRSLPRHLPEDRAKPRLPHPRQAPSRPDPGRPPRPGHPIATTALSTRQALLQLLATPHR